MPVSFLYFEHNLYWSRGEQEDKEVEHVYEAMHNKLARVTLASVVGTDDQNTKEHDSDIRSVRMREDKDKLVRYLAGEYNHNK